MRRLNLTSLALASAVALTACVQPAPPTSVAPLPLDDVEALSLFDKPLAAPELAPEVRRDREDKLAAAKADAAARPDDPEALIWLGRRTAYLGRFREAIEIFSRGVARYPQDARFLRHRGHRYISIRRFDMAETDLEDAARLIAGQPDEVEPDGLPNAAGIPVSTLQTNIWYHLGLARYLQADYPGALEAYRACLEVSKNPDMQVATRQWMYLTLRRLGDDAEATRVLEPIRMDMEILENQSYHKLLLMERGEIPPLSLLAADGNLDPAIGYGVGAWYLAEGRQEEAVQIFRKVVETGPWSAFGAIAAEVDLHRLGEGT